MVSWQIRRVEVVLLTPASTLTTDAIGARAMADLSTILIPDSVQQRFWAKVDVRGPDECWPWTAAGNQKGYGFFSYKCRNVVASRFCLIIEGRMPSHGEMFALHSCDNPSCVNPAHLRWGTASDNMQDKILRGRQPPRQFKSHCRNGHLLEGRNLLFKKTGERTGCRTCSNEGRKRRWLESKAAAERERA